MNRRCLAAFLAAALIVAFASDVRAQTASPEDILKLYVADLRKNPTITTCGRRSSGTCRP